MNGRLQRARAIVAHKEIQIDAVTTRHPEFGNIRMGTFECQSQSRPGLVHRGSFMYNGHLIEEECSCSCEDWVSGNICMHAQAALIKDVADLQEALS